MKENVTKKLLIQMIGVAASMCMAGAYNPIAFSYFAAAYMEPGQKMLLLPVMLISAAFTMPFVPAVKYMIAMLAAAALFGLTSLGKRESGKLTKAFLAGLSVMTVHISGVLTSVSPGGGILAGVLEGILTVALSLVLNKGIHAFLVKKRHEAYSNDEMVSMSILFAVVLYAMRGLEIYGVPAAPVFMYLGILCFAYCYGVGMGAAAGAACGVVMTLWQKDVSALGMMSLVGVMAGSFRSLGKLWNALAYLAGIWFLGTFATSFLMDYANVAGVLWGTLLFLLIPGRFLQRMERRTTEGAENVILEERKGRILDMADSLKMLSKSIGRFHKQNDLSFATSVQLSETALALEEMTNIVSFTEKKEKRRTEQKIRSVLERAKLEVKHVYIIEQPDGRERIYIRARTRNGRIMTAKEGAVYVSSGYGKTVRPSSECRNIINSEYEQYTFVAEANFMALYGSAGVTKDGEEISGDNFTCMELAEGKLMMGIIDGMGSGADAYEDSEQVVELLEELLKAGYSETAALKLVNSVLLGKDGEEASAAVDIALTDLYSGKLSLFKSGAAATFIKRNQWVEVMKSTSLPIGVLKEVDYESAYKKLYDGDYIIMVSDGVLEAFQGENKEEELGRELMELDIKKPKDMADAILNMAYELADGRVKDDMTVLVTGIWKKSA